MTKQTCQKHLARRTGTLIFFGIMAGGLSDCATVGKPGFAHHPLSCAVGNAEADCLPGTPGYNNGGGQQTRAQQVDRENSTIKAQLEAEKARAESELQNPELDLIRQKVELSRPNMDSPPPFEIASNDSFPNSSCSRSPTT